MNNNCGQVMNNANDFLVKTCNDDDSDDNPDDGG